MRTLCGVLILLLATPFVFLIAGFWFVAIMWAIAFQGGTVKVNGNPVKWPWET